jgi:hypothetical protein
MATMSEPDPPPVVVVPPFDPKLMPYAQWRQDEDKGARAAHDDARRPPSGRMTPEDIAAEGYPFWSGYMRHTTALRDAGVIQ